MSRAFQQRVAMKNRYISSCLFHLNLKPLLWERMNKPIHFFLHPQLKLYISTMKIMFVHLALWGCARDPLCDLRTAPRRENARDQLHAKGHTGGSPGVMTV